MKYVISVAKTYKHRGYHQHRTAKKHWFVYFYEYNEFTETLHMKSKQVNLLQAVYYMTQKHHRLKMICPDCETKFLALVKKNQKEIECPYCLHTDINT